jgi:DNA-binding protein
MSEKPDSIVYVGSKPINAYILACVTQFTEGADEVTLKARGRAISRAVDVAEILRRKFMPDSVELVDVAISTETIDDSERGKSNVSAMEIILRKKTKDD